jgi:hypothetical protein
MDIMLNLVEGVVSSFLAIALTELYLMMRKRLRNRPLRSLLGYSDRVAVIIPELPRGGGGRTGTIMATHDAIALAHLLDACNRVNTTTVLAAASQLPVDLPSLTMLIGGPVSNPLASFYLQKYCSNFRPITEDNYDRGFEVPGAGRFDETSDTTWSYIIRLDSSMTDRAGTVILLWGATAHATATAAYYFVTNSRLLPWRDRNFFVALSVDRKLGYRSVQRSPIDVSGQIFASRRSH